MARQFEENLLPWSKEPYQDDVPQRIKSISFETLAEEDIQKSAQVQVWKSTIYDATVKPDENGLIDLRMGPTRNSKELVCMTCHGEFADCQGHFGYTKLAHPVYNVGFFKHVVNILKCICKHCGRILLADKDRRELLTKMRSPMADAAYKKDLLKYIIKKCEKASYCFNKDCKLENGNVQCKQRSLDITYKFSKGCDVDVAVQNALSHKQERLSYVIDPRKVVRLFKKIINEDIILLNLKGRPEHLMMETLPVPPGTIRPSSLGSSSYSSNEDSITCILKGIININSILREVDKAGEAPYKMDTLWAHLQMKAIEYINSESRFIRESTNRGFLQRLKGKQGRFRGNLTGKRVNHTGRTVISPDPNLKITDVGVPVLMAKVLTYPERVSNHNIEELRRCVRNGPTKHPGANYITLPDGTTLDLKYKDRKIAAVELKPGDIVERHLKDGDVVLFNRQPSLHRMSFMCHSARIRPGRTLQFNESVCNPYNADFDGDEMNLHVPQTEEARTEALMLMGVQNNLCTPKNGEILVASTQDFLTTSFLITRKDTFYDRSTFSLLCSYLGDAMEAIDLPTPALIKPIELWTGKQVFSVLVRPNAQMRVFLNLTVEEKNYTGNKWTCPETMCPADGWVYFRNSELISGQIGKATLGNGNKDGLYSVLLRDYNAHAAVSCMNRWAKFSARWIGNHGFSIGIDDVQPGERLNEQKSSKINKGYEKCEEFTISYSATLEHKITETLNEIRSDVANVCMKELHWRNSPLIMSQCGSKGSPMNISQMVACVGQQTVGGMRAPNGFIDRTLPHFPINSKTPAAKGFVVNSFYTGLTPTEFFFHTMGGREGLVDTAVKTAETGYMSRRLMKGLEDLAVYYDQTVRNASGEIVQFLYGDDGMDPAKMEGKDGVPLNLDQLFMKVMATCPHRNQAVLSPSEIFEITDERLSKPDASPEGGCSRRFKELLEKFVNKRVTFCKNMRLLHLDEDCGENKNSGPEERVAANISGISAKQLQKSGCSIYPLVRCGHNLRRSLHLDEDYAENKNSSPEERVSANFSGISAKQLQIFLETCISRCQLKKVEAGTAVGAIGAHSIGEPGTQMTLKTFHFAGVASMNVTLGIPRIKEIINATEKISTFVITAILSNDKDELSARMVKRLIEKTVLGEVVDSIKVVLKAGQPYIDVKLDMERIDSLHMRIHAKTVQQSILEDPIVEKTFRELKKSFRNLKIKLKLEAEHVRVIRNNKLRIYSPVTDKSWLQLVLHALKFVIPKVTVKGIHTVKRVVIEKKKRNEDNKDIEVYNLAVEGTCRCKNSFSSTLSAVMATPGIDGSKTTSNHVMEVQHTLGIEAARECIITEILFIMRCYGISIDIRHIMLLADLMTYKGRVLGFTRFGISKMKDSVLMLASFEKPDEYLLDAAYSGKEDRIEGVSECIITGKPMLLGTGMFKIRQRLDSIPEFKYQPDPILS